MIDESIFDDFPATCDKNSQPVIEMKKSGNGDTYYPDFSAPQIVPSLPLNTAPLQHITNAAGMAASFFGQQSPINIIIPQRVLVPCPENQDEVQARASIRRKCLQHFLNFKRQIFGGIKGVRSSDGSCIEYGSIKVSLKGFWNLNLYIPPGGGIDTITRRYALDPIELLSMINDCSYKRALELLTYFYKPDESGKNTITYEKESGEWVNETKRLVRAFIMPLSFLYTESQPTFVYTNEINDQIAIVSHIKHFNSVKTYHLNTLWRHKKSGVLHWFEIQPYVFPLFNQNNIFSNKNAAIIFVDSEELVESNQKQNKLNEKVFTTCFGGHINLLKADLKPLYRRIVIIACSLNSPEIQLIPQIIERLSNAQLKELYFTFDNDKTRVSVQEFMADPVKWGCNASLNEAESVKSNIFLDNEKWKNYIKNSPPRSKLLSNIILGGQLIWIYAPPKIGKTWLGLSIAYAVRKGGCKIGPWETFTPVKVLYIDGEMHHEDLNTNINMVMLGQGDTSGSIPFNVLSASLTQNGRVNLLDDDYQKNIESYLIENKIQLVIADNFYSLTDNPQQAFNIIVDWLCKLRSLGITVIVLDHTNEEDKVQGEKKKLWRADLGISIQKDPEDTTERIILLNLIGRRLTEDDKQPVRLRKIFTEDSFKFELVEGHKATEPETPEEIIKYAKAFFFKEIKKMTYKETESEMGIPKSTIENHLKRDIPKLTENNKKLFEKELSRLIAEDKMAALR